MSKLLSMSTLSEVAERAGVSLATASRVLNGAAGRTVRPDLAERVQTAADELKYVPHAGAQAMARGVSNIVCLLVNDIADPYSAAVAAGIGRVATENRLLMAVTSTGSSAANRTPALQVLAAQQVRGVIIAGDAHGGNPDRAELSTCLETLRANGTTVVSIGAGEVGVASVQLPDQIGTKHLAEKLLGAGHRSFVILAGPVDRASAVQRTKAFTETVEAGGGRIVTTMTGGFDRASAEKSVHDLLGVGRLPDVIFATNDLQALGALRALRTANLNVPHDVGLAAFGDSGALSDAVPGITSVSVDASLAGELATRLVLGDENVAPEPVVPHEVRMRESTRN